MSVCSQWVKDQQLQLYKYLEEQVSPESRSWQMVFHKYVFKRFNAEKERSAHLRS